LIDEQPGVLIWASQLRANDFPPVCAMSGRPAQTWRQFYFAHRSGYLPLTRRSARKLTLALWLPIGALVLAVLLWIAAIAFGVSSVGSENAIRSSVAYASWTDDPEATSGPHPGYRPVLSDITGTNITYAGVTKDSNGTDWDMELQFDSGAATRLANLSRAAIAACPGDFSTDPKAACDKRHLSIWIGLTLDDIAHWDDAYYAGDISKPAGSGCLDLATQIVCGKLLYDSGIDQPLDGGDIVYPIGTRQDAQALVDEIQPPPNAGFPWRAAIAWGLAGVGVLLLVAGVLGLVVIRRMIGPRAVVVQELPGYYDSLIELRNVHPAFVAAVTSIQHARAAPQTPPPPSAQPQSEQAPPGRPPPLQPHA
jgi:hypothetical protein